MRKPLRRFISAPIIVIVLALLPASQSKADIWGGDVIVLTKILIEAIQQTYKLSAILGKSADTVRILEEMNRGVKDVLKIAETAHVILPPGVYDQAKQIDRATSESKRLYGSPEKQSPTYAQANYRSGVEALSLSQGTFDYTTYLDQQGERIKAAAIVSNQATATRLTAESIGVLLHSSNHGNRIQAKSLELESNSRIEEISKENAKFESFLKTHEQISSEMNRSSISSLNAVDF